MAGTLDPAHLESPNKGGIFGAYGQSKLALTVASATLAGPFASRGIDVFAVDPGGNRTSMTAGHGAPFFVRWMRWALPAPQKGAALLAAPLLRDMGNDSGALLVNGKRKALPQKSNSPPLRAALNGLIRSELGFSPEAP